MRAIYKIMIILILIFSCIVPVSADETEWVDPQEKTLRLTESFAREGYLIEASDFYDNSALITIYDANHKFVTRNITRINDYIVVDNVLNITVLNLQEVSGNISAGHGLNVIVDQWVRIQTRVSGTPSPKVSIIPKSIEINNKTIIRRTFIPGSEIPINFSIKNEGKAKLKNIILKINTSLPVLYEEKLNYEIYELGSGNESDVITVRFQAPHTEERKLFLISADVKGYDAFGKSYQAVDLTNIEVAPQFDNKIELRKYVSEKVYIGDVAIVSISIRNNGSQKFDKVNLTDSLPPGIEPVDTNLSWNFTLGPFEQKLISYIIKPQKPGSYYLLPGSSIIEYQGILDYNGKPAKLIVNGPYVILMKSVNTYEPFKGENFSVTIEAKNMGDATAIVKLSDALPENYSLTKENESYRIVPNTMVLHPGSSASLSYSLTASTSGRFILPPAKATVLDQTLYQDERYTQRTASAEIAIDVREPLELEGPSVTITSIPKKSETPKSTETTTSAPKSVDGLKGYIFIMVFIVIWIIKKSNFKI